MTGRWHILSPEFPPECGGVGDYVAQLAPALAAASGERVTVWVPPGPPRVAAGDFDVALLPDRFGAAARDLLERRLAADGTGARLLVQYVGNVFGLRGANLPFSRWIAAQRLAGREVRVMIHEPYLYYRWRPDHLAVAIAQRSMAATLVRAASRLYLSTETWRRYLARFDPEAVARATVLPIPSTIPRVDASDAVHAARAAALRGRSRLVGHFGTYGAQVAPLVERTLLGLLRTDDSAAVLCVGRDSGAFVARLARAAPSLAARISASGLQRPEDVSIALQACDVLFQPYPDGVTTRRTSVMAGLANGVAVVTSAGDLTEPIWRESGAVALAPVGDAPAGADALRALLTEDAGRRALAAKGLALYRRCFELGHTIAALLEPEPAHA